MPLKSPIESKPTLNTKAQKPRILKAIKKQGKLKIIATEKLLPTTCHIYTISSSAIVLSGAHLFIPCFFLFLYKYFLLFLVEVKSYRAVLQRQLQPPIKIHAPRFIFSTLFLYIENNKLTWRGIVVIR